MNFLQGEIVYIKFPFTDLSNYKLRPALILSNKNYNKKDNLLLLGIFSAEGIKDFSMKVDQNDLSDGKILKQSFFRFQNIFSLDKSLVERKIGKVKFDKFQEIVFRLNNYIEIES